jgi:putative peptidoglycan lipid II flippase
VLGYLSVRHLPLWIGIDPRWGIAGLTASAGVAGWVEFLLLRRALGLRIGADPVGARYLARLWITALAAAGVAWAIKLELPAMRYPYLGALATLIPYGALYLLLADPSQITKRFR